jgi:hypothetical protein
VIDSHTKRFTIQHNCTIDKGDISCEKEQEFDHGPSSRPDERDFAWQREKVVVDLRIGESDSTKHTENRYENTCI